MEIRPLYDPATSTLTYVVFDAATRDAVVIDPVLDYDPAGGTVETRSLQRVADVIEAHQLELRYVLETHAHADHLSGAQWLKSRYGAKIAIGKRITEVQETFKDMLDLGPTFRADGSQFERAARRW